MKQQDLTKHHHMSIAELTQTLVQKEQELVDTRVKISLSQEKNVHLAKNIRQDIARIKTIIHGKLLAGEKTVPKPASKTPPNRNKKTVSKKSSPNKVTKEV